MLFHVVLVGLFLIASDVTPSLAQPKSTVRRKPTPFARYVPDSAKLFVTIRELGEVNAALDRGHAWRLLPILAGGPADDDTPFDLRLAVTALVGPHGSIAIDELMQAEVGIVATGPAELDTAVWFVRISDRKIFDRWFPKQHRRGEAKTGPLLSFRTRDGMRVSLCGDVAALTRRAGQRDLLRDIQRLMARRGGKPLERSTTFQKLVNRLPSRHLAIAYWAAHAESPGKDADATILPAIDRVVVGLYERDGRIDFAIRASRASPHAGIPIGTSAIQPLMQLPQTTLFALAAKINFDEIYTAAKQSRSRGVWSRYLTVLAGMAWRASSKPEPADDSGVNVIVIWGQDLREHGSAPQLAVMMEAPNPLALRSEVTRIASNMLKLTRADPGLPAEAAPTIIQTSHLGTAILHVPLRAYADHSESPTGRLLGGIDPAWTVWRNWFIFALSHDHLERILDGQHRLIPTLGSVGDVHELRSTKGGRTVLAIAQPALAADVVDRWLEDFKIGAPSILASSFWEQAARPTGPTRADLDIGWRAGSSPGVALVTKVPADSAAHGLLRPNDRVIGVNGRLLDLASPSADLDAQLSSLTTDSKLTLRVRRGDTMTDVTVPLDSADRTVARPPISPADAVGEFASLGRALRFATLTVHATDETQYAARLSIRLAPDNSP